MGSMLETSFVADPVLACERATLHREQVCPSCRGELQAEILEAWYPRDFTLDACCEVMQDAILEALAEGGARSRSMLLALDADACFGSPIRGVVRDECLGYVGVDFVPRIERIAFGAATAFIRNHHAHCAPPPGWRFGMGAWNGRQLIAVATVGRPVSRIIAQDPGVLEVTRLCTDRTVAQALRSNLISMLLSRAAKESRGLGATRLITYTLEHEDGSSLRASGFHEESVSRGGRWSRSSRPRADAGALGPKRRWARNLTSQVGPRSRAPGPPRAPEPGHITLRAGAA